MQFELTLLATITLHHLLVGTCLLLVLGVVISACRFSAELQSWLWTTAFAICVLVPFVSLVPGAEPPSHAVERAKQTEVDAGKAPPAASGSAADGIKNTRPSVKGPLQWNLPGQWVNKVRVGLYGFLLVWLLGSAWRAINMVRSIRRTRGLVKSAIPYKGTGCGKHIARCPLLVSESGGAPMAAGLVDPVILLPKHFVERFDADRLTPIILHEWAHIQRGDLWVATFQELVAVVFWWSPVMRLINRKIHVSRELACDMRAVRALENRKWYAQSLLDCAELMVTRQQSVLAMGLFSKKKDLTERINTVLKFKTKKTPKSLTTATACSVLAVTSLAAAQAYAPRIDLAAIASETNYMSGLSRVEGELLMEVIRNNDFQALGEMLSNGLDINTPVPGEGTALIEAVRQNSREMVELLIRTGADVNQPARGDGNPLIAAARHNHMELAELLYQRGADLDAAIPRDGSPLIVAIRSGHDAMAEQLIDWGADVNQAAEREGNPLIAAAMTGSLRIAKRLHRAGADVNGVVPTDETPLINASHQGHFEMVRFLVENGADVNLGVLANGDEFRTPLNRARNSEVREYLIAMGATE